MKKLNIFFAIGTAIFIAGCDDIREKLHMLPNQDEQECLNSERLNFKDPDVLFVANLGSRGLETKVDQYWVRYKAKNSYGAYLQGNMLCMKKNEKWVRDTTSEFLLELQLEGDLLEKINAKIRSDPVFSKTYFESGLKPDEQGKKAKALLFESPDNLDKYFSVKK